MEKKTAKKDNPKVQEKAQVMLNPDHKSRFFTVKDESSNTFIFKLNPGWWSRPYEYLWAKRFLEKGNKVLDLACGLPHPFRFVCEQVTANAWACDLDANISDQTQTVNSIRYHHGDNAVSDFLRSLEEYKAIFDKSFHSDIKDIKADSDSFDTVFCISVLEHLESKQDIELSLKEMYRVLKPEGLVVLTVDYPNIDPEYLVNKALELGFKLAGDIDYELPKNAINTDYLGQNIKVFRLLFTK